MTPEQLAELRNSIMGELRTLMQTGEDARAQQVRDLEARLAETEAELRSHQTNPTLPTQGSDDVFRGVFLTDPDVIRTAMRGINTANAEVRAIDTSLFATGGRLNPDQANAFLDYSIAQQPTMQRIREIRMMSSQGMTDELVVSKRKLRKATEGTAPALANAIGTKRRTLTTEEVIWAEDITLTFLEDNIEKRNADQTIARALAIAFGNDVADLAWNGDTAAGAGPDQAFLSINNGWFKIIDAATSVNNVVATGFTTARQTLRKTFNAMPSKFKGRTDHAYFCSTGFAEMYADEVSARETNLGDGVLLNGLPVLRFFGIPLIPDPNILASSARLVLTPAQNLTYGVQRVVTFESEWQPRKRVVEYTITARNDFEIASEEAIVSTESIPAGLQG